MGCDSVWHQHCGKNCIHFQDYVIRVKNWFGCEHRLLFKLTSEVELCI
jgi:hypothetical protein